MVRHLELLVRDDVERKEDTEELEDLVDELLDEPPLRPRIKASTDDDDEFVLERFRIRKLPNNFISDGN